jgi:hypothetical protein
MGGTSDMPLLPTWQGHAGDAKRHGVGARAACRAREPLHERRARIRRQLQPAVLACSSNRHTQPCNVACPPLSLSTLHALHAHHMSPAEIPTAP